jgi:hypothetical protein
VLHVDVEARECGVHRVQYLSRVGQTRSALRDCAIEVRLAALQPFQVGHGLANDLLCVLVKMLRPKWLHRVVPETREGTNVIQALRSVCQLLDAAELSFSRGGGNMRSMLDRETLLQHFSLAERHVSQGERHVARQREIVAELKDDGRDLETARNLLASFEELYRRHVADRDRIRQELANVAW